jgi:hypothetical protein
LENLTLLENRKAIETEIILQTQLARSFAEKRQADFENLAQPAWNTANEKRHNRSKPPQTETLAKNLEANFSDWTKPT